MNHKRKDLNKVSFGIAMIMIIPMFLYGILMIFVDELELTIISWSAGVIGGIILFIISRIIFSIIYNLREKNMNNIDCKVLLMEMVQNYKQACGDDVKSGFHFMNEKEKKYFCKLYKVKYKKILLIFEIVFFLITILCVYINYYYKVNYSDSLSKLLSALLIIEFIGIAGNIPVVYWQGKIIKDKYMLTLGVVEQVEILGYGKKSRCCADILIYDAEYKTIRAELIHDMQGLSLKILKKGRPVWIIKKDYSVKCFHY